MKTLKNLTKEQRDLINGKLNYLYSIDRVSAYEYGQLNRYFEDIQKSKKPILNFRSKENSNVRTVYERLVKELEVNIN